MKPGFRIFWATALVLLISNVVAAGGDVRGAWVGLVVTYEDRPELAEGRMTVATVHPEGPAAKAGLRVGDVICRVNGQTFRFPDWTATVSQGGPFSWAKPGEVLRMAVERGEKTEILEVVAMVPPAAIVEERQKFQASLAERRGPQVFDALARRGAVVEIEREVADGPLRAVAKELTSEEQAALSSYFNSTRLRVLFVKLAPGKTQLVQLGTDAETGETKIEILR